MQESDRCRILVLKAPAPLLWLSLAPKGQDRISFGRSALSSFSLLEMLAWYGLGAIVLVLT